MSWKGIVIIGVVLVFLAGLGAMVYKITQTTETYKAREQHYNNPTFNLAPLSFGCVSFRAEAAKVQNQTTRKPGNRTISNATGN